MPTAEELAQKQFDEADKRWTAPKFFSLGALTLFIAISLIYFDVDDDGLLPPDRPVACFPWR